MTVPRSKIVDPDVTLFYHCISRCVRGAYLCGEGYEHRKKWIEERLEELAAIFAVETCGYSVLDNHFHTLVKLEPETVKLWSDEQVIRRWGALYPPRDKKRQPLPVSDDWVKERLREQEWITEMRGRLCNLGWFMKSLKEPLARLANDEDQTHGAFFAGRYKSIAILDEEALLTTMTYIDLNPLAAGVAAIPEESLYTSIRTRIMLARAAGRMDALTNLPAGTIPHPALEDIDQWLCPIQYLAESRSASVQPALERGDSGPGTPQRGRGMIAGFTLAAYLRLVDWASRQLRTGKAHVTTEVASIMDRLGSSPELWWERMKVLMNRTRPLGVAFAASRERLNQAAAHRGCQRLANVNGCPT